MPQTGSKYKAVFFDVGGVCVHSPLEGIRIFERSKGLPENYLNVAIQARGEGGAFQKLERGELALSVFYPVFGNECSDPANKLAYANYLKAKGKPAQNIPDVMVDGKELFTVMMQEAAKTDSIVLGAIRRLRESGRFKVAALTNNFQFEGTDDEKALARPPPEFVQMFDAYIESSIVGLRKPDPKFFRYACEKMGVEPKDAIMLDDIGPNLKSAKEVGMTPIRVIVGKSKEAIRALEELVNMELIEEETPAQEPLVTSAHILYIADNEEVLKECTERGAVCVDQITGGAKPQQIEIPTFQVLEARHVNRQIHEKFPKGDPSVNPNEELSDETYKQRHRKHEYAEKRLKNREKEYVRHQLYKRRMLDPRHSAHVATFPRSSSNPRDSPELPTTYLKSAFIILQPPEEPPGEVCRKRGDSRSERQLSVSSIGKSTPGPSQVRKSTRVPMAFGHPIAVLPSKAFERSQGLLELLQERGKM